MLPIYYSCAGTLEAICDKEEMSNYFMQVLRYDPLNIPVRSRVIVCITHVGVEKVKEFFRERHAISSDDLEVCSRLALLIKKIEPQFAERLFERVLEGKTDHFIALKYYGIMLRKKDPARSEQLLEQARAQVSDDPVILANLGELKRLEGDEDGTITLLEASLRCGHTHLAVSRRAEIFRTKGDKFAAYTLFERALGLKPHSHYSIGRLGTLLFEHGPEISPDLDRARACFEKAFEKYPDDPVLLSSHMRLIECARFSLGSGLAFGHLKKDLSKGKGFDNQK